MYERKIIVCMDIKKIDKTIIEAYFRALDSDSANLNSVCIKRFREKHDDVYRYLHAFYRLRCEMYKDIKIMDCLGRVEWFTLTFDNKRDKALISSKRKSATRFLNDLFIAYEMIEEFGDDNGRYHIHGFGVFKDNKGFNDFVKWPSRQKIETLREYNLRKKVKYLTAYASKCLPRRRRSKTLVYLSTEWNKHKGLKNSFETCFNCKFNLALVKVRFGVYNKSSKRDIHQNIQTTFATALR